MPPRPLTPFTTQAAEADAELAPLLIALAREFEPVDVGAATAALDGLAGEIAAGLGAGSDPVAQAEAIARLPARVAVRSSPEDALLHAVVRRREGHPLTLAAACAEAARRAGIGARPVRACAGFFVGLAAGGRTLLVDPTRECRGAPGRAVWMCAHEVAFLSLGELARLYAMHGRLPAAIRASELRAHLPVSTVTEERIGFETDALRAQLN